MDVASEEAELVMDVRADYRGQNKRRLIKATVKVTEMSKKTQESKVEVLRYVMTIEKKSRKTNNEN